MPANLVSNTQAPPAGAPAVDLNKAFGDMTVHPSATTAQRPSSSRHQEPHRPSAPRAHEASRAPPSSSRTRDPSHRPSAREPSSLSRTHSQPISTSRQEPDGRVTTTQTHKKKGFIRGLFGGNETTAVSITAPLEHRSRSHTSHSSSSRTHHSSSTHHRTSNGSSSRRHEHSSQPSSPSTTRKTQATEDPKTKVRTESSKMPVGNMERSYLEGMVPATEFVNIRGTNLRGMVPASEYAQNGGTYPVHTHIASIAPSNVKSVFQNETDVKMASRQTHYESMSPEDKTKQETWAQSFLKRTSVCPEGYKWLRKSSGYLCEGGTHFTSDEQITEGKRGCYSYDEQNDSLAGPYYPNLDDPDYYKYCGLEPRAPGVPSRVGPRNAKARRERELTLQMAGITGFNSGNNPMSQHIQQSMMHSGMPSHMAQIMQQSFGHSGQHSHSHSRGHSGMLGGVVNITHNGVTTQYGSGGRHYRLEPDDSLFGSRGHSYDEDSDDGGSFGHFPDWKY